MRMSYQQQLQALHSQVVGLEASSAASAARYATPADTSAAQYTPLRDLRGQEGHVADTAGVAQRCGSARHALPDAEQQQRSVQLRSGSWQQAPRLQPEIHPPEAHKHPRAADNMMSTTPAAKQTAYSTPPGQAPAQTASATQHAGSSDQTSRPAQQAGQYVEKPCHAQRVGSPALPASDSESWVSAAPDKGPAAGAGWLGQHVMGTDAWHGGTQGTHTHDAHLQHSQPSRGQPYNAQAGQHMCLHTAMGNVESQPQPMLQWGRHEVHHQCQSACKAPDDSANKQPQRCHAAQQSTQRVADQQGPQNESVMPFKRQARARRSPKRTATVSTCPAEAVRKSPRKQATHKPAARNRVPVEAQKSPWRPWSSRGTSAPAPPHRLSRPPGAHEPAAVCDQRRPQPPPGLQLPLAEKHRSVSADVGTIRVAIPVTTSTTAIWPHSPMRDAWQHSSQAAAVLSQTLQHAAQRHGHEHIAMPHPQSWQHSAAEYSSAAAGMPEPHFAKRTAHHHAAYAADAPQLQALQQHMQHHTRAVADSPRSQLPPPRSAVIGGTGVRVPVNVAELSLRHMGAEGAERPATAQPSQGVAALGQARPDDAAVDTAVDTNVHASCVGARPTTARPQPGLAALGDEVPVDHACQPTDVQQQPRTGSADVARPSTAAPSQGLAGALGPRCVPPGGSCAHDAAHVADARSTPRVRRDHQPHWHEQEGRADVRPFTAPPHKFGLHGTANSCSHPEDTSWCSECHTVTPYLLEEQSAVSGQYETNDLTSVQQQQQSKRRRRKPTRGPKGTRRCAYP